MALFQTLLNRAKAGYPAEDGWVVVNLSRMQELLDMLTDSELDDEVSLAETEPSAGSLAEAIAIGNIGIAYDLVESRPMVALAEAAAEFTNILRVREGATMIDQPVSALLQQTTAPISTAKLSAAIEALNSALDGTSADERTAVQVAILRATNALHQ